MEQFLSPACTPRRKHGRCEQQEELDRGVAYMMVEVVWFDAVAAEESDADAVPPLGGEGFESLGETLLVGCAVATAFIFVEARVEVEEAIAEDTAGCVVATAFFCFLSIALTLFWRSSAVISSPLQCVWNSFPP
jgi:hypothetical protein